MKQKQAILFNHQTIKIIFPYDSSAVERVKQLPGRKYHNEGWDKKYWTAPLCVENVEMLKGMNFEIHPEVQAWYSSITSPPPKCNIDKIEGLKGELYPFQKEGVSFIESRRGKSLLGDEMGLGKTIQAIAWTLLHPEVKKILIICPLSVMLFWKKEIMTWTGNEAVAIRGNQSQRENLYEEFMNNPHKKYLIVNYDILSTDLNFIQNL